MKSLKNLKTRINIEYYNPPESSSVVQYCLDSSLHGLQYVGQQNRHCVERVIWLAAFIASVTCAGLLINQLWKTYHESPIVTVFNSEDIPLSDIAFPSITICNLHPLKISKLKEHMRNFYFNEESNNVTPKFEAVRYFRDVLHICEKNVLRQSIQELFSENYTDQMYMNFNEALQNFTLNDKSDGNPSQQLSDSAQDCYEMIKHCIREYYLYDCKDLFRPILTDFGFCCTFHMIPLSFLIKNFNDGREGTDENQHWKFAGVNFTSEDLVFPPITNASIISPIFRQAFPRRTFGLSVVLEPNLKDYLSCGNTGSDGFLIGLHSPLDFPQMKDSGLLIPPGMETFVKISPQITIADKSIKKFPLNKRKCYFDDEVDQILTHHTKYSAKNCKHECISRIIQEAHGCVPFYNISKPSNVKYCDPSIKIADLVLETSTGCTHCYSACTDIEYQADFSSIPTKETNLKSCADYCIDKSSEGAIVHLNFAKDKYQARIRKEMYTVIDLISSAGGLLGLCMGFSMLSILEVLYYFTIRLCCIYRRKHIQKGSGSSDVNVELASSYDKMVQDGMLAKKSKNCKSPAFKVVRRRSAWSVKK